jgi:hypothetical protein
MDVSAAEKVGAVLGLIFALGVLVISLDILSSGRLLGWAAGDVDEDQEAEG